MSSSRLKTVQFGDVNNMIYEASSIQFRQWNPEKNDWDYLDYDQASDKIISMIENYYGKITIQVRDKK